MFDVQRKSLRFCFPTLPLIEGCPWAAGGASAGSWEWRRGRYVAMNGRREGYAAPAKVASRGQTRFPLRTPRQNITDKKWGQQGENAEKIKKRVFQTLRILWGSTLLHIVYNICYRVSMQNYNTEPFIISLFLYSLFISHYMILINQAFSISHRIQQYGERNVN